MEPALGRRLPDVRVGRGGEALERRSHHPFTAPTDEDLPLLFAERPADRKIRSKAYDMVLNGTELGGGSIRIHRADVQSKVFELLGISPEEAAGEVRLPARRRSQYGAPPHGGIAFGLDRS